MPHTFLHTLFPPSANRCSLLPRPFACKLFFNPPSANRTVKVTFFSSTRISGWLNYRSRRKALHISDCHHEGHLEARTNCHGKRLLWNSFTSKLFECDKLDLYPDFNVCTYIIISTQPLWGRQGLEWWCCTRCSVISFCARPKILPSTWTNQPLSYVNSHPFKNQKIPFTRKMRGPWKEKSGFQDYNWYLRRAATHVIVESDFGPRNPKRWTSSSVKVLKSWYRLSWTMSGGTCIAPGGFWTHLWLAASYTPELPHHAISSYTSLESVDFKKMRRSLMAD